MSSEGITVSAPTIYDLRARLGIRFPWVGIYLSGDNLAPTLRLDVDGESRTFTSAKALCKFLQPRLAKRLVVPKQKKPKREKKGRWKKK